MSGPIVRKYGFPNFEQIFGKRDLQHGVEDAGGPPQGTEQPASTDKADEKPTRSPKAGAPEG